MAIVKIAFYLYKLRKFGIRNNAHSAYGFISKYAFCPFHAICWEVHPLLTSPGIKVKDWKGEKVKGCRHHIKSKKQVIQYTYPFIGMCWGSSFTIIEFPLDISFRVVMQHTSPLENEEKERGLLIPKLTYKLSCCIKDLVFSINLPCS